MADEDRVRGMAEATAQAEAGMALFGKEDVLVYDKEGAAAYKEAHEVKMKEKEAEAAALTGKDNAKARKEATKAASDMKKDEKYIDALKVLKDLVPPKGNFMTRQKIEMDKPKEEGVVAAPVKEEKKKEPSDKQNTKKKQESTGLSKDEKDELVKLKNDLITRKAELKAQGLSGGACNKDEQVVQWVARMQELKIKEDPSLAEAKPETKKKEKVKSRETAELEGQIEEYKEKLKTEFGYSKKEIQADPDLLDMQAALKKLTH